jgi:mRNA-degrading endonuclease RelE of RelBE toxin-antitoxin system
MTVAWFSEPAEKELKRFNRADQQRVSTAISLLEDETFRQQNKLDLNLREGGYKIWALVTGIVWLAFHEDNDEKICIDWVSLRSRFES